MSSKWTTYSIQYREHKNDHPYNYWLSFGCDLYEDITAVTTEIHGLGKRMAVAYDHPLEFRVIRKECTILDTTITIKP